MRLMVTMKAVVLHILENENKSSVCLGRLSCEGVGNLGEFRTFLEGFREKPIIPWPFEFWDSKLNRRIATELEQINPLELHDYAVTVIRSHGGQSKGKEFMVIREPTIVEESSKAGLINLTCDQNEVFPCISSLSGRPRARAPVSSSCEQDLQKETSCLKLESKHTIFLSHSGIQKPFVEQLCKDLEAQNYYPFFDQRSSSLPKGEEFSSLITDAAKKCKVAVVVLSKEYLSSKWPMLELVEFVSARESNNKNLKLLPLFYKASVEDLSNNSIQNQWMSIWVKLVGGDSRVDLEQWDAAVRKLRGVNGLSFDKFGNSEVSYRDAIVKEIFTLTPPSLLYETSKIYGGDRICKILAGMFLPHTSTSAEVLGLYGMGGSGKTTIAKFLCNHFNQQFLGRVCYIEIKEEAKILERQQMVMRKLLRLHDLLLQNVQDISEGWGLLRSRIEGDPVFLVIDNVQFDGVSLGEAREYLNLVYKSGSKILVISRSSDVVEDLLGESCYCYQIPCLTTDEAAGIFLQHGAPLMDYSSLTGAERRVVNSCLEEAWFSHLGSRYGNLTGQFHPLALRALGVYLHESSKPSEILSWNTYLHEYTKLKGSRESYKRMFKILGLQFNSLDRTTQLMFLDTSLYASKALESDMLSNSPFDELIGWLANIHGELTEVVRSKVLDFKRFDMINIEGEKVIVHDLYKEYAEWFLGQVNCEEEIRGVWCVGTCRELESSLRLLLQSTPPGRCWPNLKRIRLENISNDSFPALKVQEWCNVVVLQILRCENLTAINLQGLSCLRHLELKYLKNLKTLAFTGDGSSSISSVLPPLQFLSIDGLSSVECLPSFSPFASLKYLEVVDSMGLTQPPSFQHCSSLARVWLSWCPSQKTLPNLDGLTSLRDLTILNTNFELYEGRALKLEGLSSLISLGALELYNIPVGNLSGLENLTRVEYIYLSDMRYLTSLPPLDNLVRSSLHMLEVWGWKRRMEGLEKYKSLLGLKLKGLAAQGEIVPHTPSKIWPRMRRIRFADAVTESLRLEQMSRQGDSSRRGHCASISNLTGMKRLKRADSAVDSYPTTIQLGWRIKTARRQDDGWREVWQLPIQGQGIISFEAQGMDSVHVAISGSHHNGLRMRLYEIIIGHSGNTISLIRRLNKERCSVAAGLTHPEGISRLWFSVDDGTSVIQVGRGEPGQDVIMTYKDPYIFPLLQYVAFISPRKPDLVMYSKIVITSIMHIPPMTPTYMWSEMIPQSILNGKWTIAANLYGRYTWAQYWMLPRAGRGIFSFVSYGPGDFYLAISSRSCNMDPMYEVIFKEGGTELRKRAQGSGVCGVIQTRCSGVRYWVLIDDRTRIVQIGQGEPCQGMFLIYKDVDFLLEARFFTFTTGGCKLDADEITAEGTLDVHQPPTFYSRALKNVEPINFTRPISGNPVELSDIAIAEILD